MKNAQALTSISKHCTVGLRLKATCYLNATCHSCASQSAQGNATSICDDMQKRTAISADFLFTVSAQRSDKYSDGEGRSLSGRPPEQLSMFSHLLYNIIFESYGVSNDQRWALHPSVSALAPGANGQNFSALAPGFKHFTPLQDPLILCVIISHFNRNLKLT